MEIQFGIFKPTSLNYGYFSHFKISPQKFYFYFNYNVGWNKQNIFYKLRNGLKKSNLSIGEKVKLRITMKKCIVD